MARPIRRQLWRPLLEESHLPGRTRFLPMNHDLITGATGLLGTYLLRQSMLAQRPLAVLVRANRTYSAKQRVQHLVGQLQRASGRTWDEPVVIEGDLGQPGLGLSPESQDWLRQHCRRVIHCAASLQFNVDAATSEPYRTNVDGTRHLLQACRALNIGEFHLISSAYVCGDRQGQVLEVDFECDQRLNNDYERSKYSAELLLRQADSLKHWTIYRPSVIVGDSESGFTANYAGAYAFLRLTRLMSVQALLQDLELPRLQYQ